MSIDAELRDAVATVPPGRWIVGVSGGADSVALLRAIVLYRPDVDPMVAHLDHEARGEASAADAAFVGALAASLDVPIVTERRSEIVLSRPPANQEAAYRAARLDLFRRIATVREAHGVLLAHHCDDRAETALLRLLRGGEPSAIGGLQRESSVAGVRIVRPLLAVRHALLETFLTDLGQPWRVDASNASDRFARNRVRMFLQERPQLVEPLLRLADASEQVRAWVTAQLVDGHRCEMLAIARLAERPDPVARIIARQWLAGHGSPREAISIAVAARLIAMARDRAAGSPQAFPGNVLVERRGDVLRVVGT